MAWYRLRATFGRRWGGYLGLVLLIGLIGGIALAAGAAVRHTESSFPVFLASTNPSDLTVQTGSPSYSGLPAFTQTLVHLAHVRRAGVAVEPIADVLDRDGGPTAASVAAGFWAATVGSVSGLYFNQDRVTVIRGIRAARTLAALARVRNDHDRPWKQRLGRDRRVGDVASWKT